MYYFLNKLKHCERGFQTKPFYFVVIQYILLSCCWCLVSVAGLLAVQIDPVGL